MASKIEGLVLGAISLQFLVSTGLLCGIVYGGYKGVQALNILIVQKQYTLM